ncbi:MAG TPA: hydantoinase/oxoprolinase family protein [Hyphomicrobiaceae bacterium]|nr:hydantoinase/oxoprolinase family protein [Hyphomicrobiaceae bacterium]
MTGRAKAPRGYRIGIDVGGTFTKAVVIDNATREVVGRHAVLTTHDHASGVAAGVVEVFRRVLDESRIAPGEVVFLAHSTTQATNALLEGDVAAVGVVGLAGSAAAHLARGQAHVPSIELGPGRSLATHNRFLVTDGIGEARVREAIAGLVAEGAQVLVASAAFGVDNTGTEELVRKLGAEAGLLTTCGHEITRLYGLATRTRTAVINASILPRMIATAAMTEASVRDAGIVAPLMIMRGDGGVMDIREMRRRPVMTMLSGPAASVAGALMHLRVADGLYFEVGGTSTNIGVIRNGRPTVAYARVGGHETYVSSLDVRVVGIAGGSLVRANPAGALDVGPRSAHIAGLPYAAFADESAIIDPQIELFEPKPGDGEDYVAVRTANGSRFALTVTCAANVLGHTKPGMHAHGRPAAARRAFEALAQFLGIGVDDAAGRVLAAAGGKLAPVVQALIEEYDLDDDQRLLIGEGGGAGSLIPYLAERMGLKFEISRDAEVISSIGAALALVRDVVERVIPHPTPDDLVAIRREALEAVVRVGAEAGSVDVTVEVDQQTHRVRAIAMGAVAMHAREDGGSITEREARAIAARSIGIAPAALSLVADTSGLRVYQAGEGLEAVRAIDGEGAIRMQRSRALARLTSARGAAGTIEELWRATSPGEGHGPAPGLFLLHGHHVVDLSGVESLAQAQALAASELADTEPDAAVALVVIAGSG